MVLRALIVSHHRPLLALNAVQHRIVCCKSPADQVCHLSVLGQQQSSTHHEPSVEVQVAEYARTYNFSQIEYDEILHRKQKLNRLFKRHGCSSSEELLDKAAQAAAGLDRWFTMEGMLICPEMSWLPGGSAAFFARQHMW